MTIALGEFIGAILVAMLTGGAFGAMWLAHEAVRAEDETRRVRADAEVQGREQYTRGCTATRASLRDALTTLPRLRCSRSISGHVRVVDVERLLAEVRDE